MSITKTNEFLGEAIDVLAEYFLSNKDYKPKGGTGRLFVKCASHRARSRVTAYIKSREQWCSYNRGVGKGVYQVTKEELVSIRKNKVKGVTKYKDGDDLFKCHKPKSFGQQGAW